MQDVCGSHKLVCKVLLLSDHGVNIVFKALVANENDFHNLIGDSWRRHGNKVVYIKFPRRLHFITSSPKFSLLIKCQNKSHQYIEF